MGLSIFLARFLGIYFLIIGAAWLLRRTQFEKSASAIVASDGAFALTGVIQLFFGLALAISHSIWEPNWRIVITIIGYLAIVQGLARLVFPEGMKSFFSHYIGKFYWAWLLLLLILGVFLTYNGFVHSD